jgi:LysR family transcriptional activator of nhaA
MKHLNYHHLRYFWVVAKEGHLTRAASKLHVSQSALSAQIRQLEGQVGHALFTREGRTLRLTEVGHVVLSYAESIFALGNELIATVSGGEGQRIQKLRVGSVATLSRNFQENFLRPLINTEDIYLVLESGNLDELLMRLSVHKLDLVLSNRAVTASDEQPWRCRRIARQPVCLVGKPLSRGRRFKFPDDLQGRKLLLPGLTNDIRVQFDLLCESLKIETDILAEVDDMAMLRLLARDFDGIALLPEVVVQDELRTGTLQQYCVVPKIYETFYAITTERRFQPAIIKKLLARKTDCD